MPVSEHEEKAVPGGQRSSDSEAGVDGSVQRSRPQAGQIPNPVSAPPPAPTRIVPDGGTQAWLQVVGVFFLYFNTWGLLSSYGSFQAFYETDLLHGHTAFEISTVGSLQSFLLVFLGWPTGPIYDAGYSRQLLAAGSLLILVGVVTQAFCTTLWQLLLAQGVCIGLGCGCLSIPSVATTSLWFSSRLTLANGVAACGSGLGGVVYPLLVRTLLSQVGFRWTVLAVALVALVTLVAANLAIREPPTPSSGTGAAMEGGAPARRRPRRALVDRASLTDWPYVLFVCACVTIFLGLYTPFFYIQSFALKGDPASRIAPNIVLAMNAASIPGRIIPFFLVRPSGGPQSLIIATAVALSAIAFGLIGATQEKQDVILGVSMVYGFFTGSFFCLQPTTYVNLTKDMRVMGTRFGMAFSVQSIALLIGSPLAGVLQRERGYQASWIWTGVTVAAGAVFISLSKGVKHLEVKQSTTP